MRVVMKRNKERVNNKVEVVCIDGVFEMAKEPKGKEIKFQKLVIGRVVFIGVRNNNGRRRSQKTFKIWKRNNSSV